MNQYEIEQEFQAQNERQKAKYDEIMTSYLEGYKEMMAPFLEATGQAAVTLAALEAGTFVDKELKE